MRACRARVVLIGCCGAAGMSSKWLDRRTTLPTIFSRLPVPCNAHVHGGQNLMRYLSPRGGSGGLARPSARNRAAQWRSFSVVIDPEESERSSMRVRYEPSTHVRWSPRRNCGPRAGPDSRRHKPVVNIRVYSFFIFLRIILTYNMTIFFVFNSYSKRCLFLGFHHF
jgi:hypothetical protein